jgi:cytochrome b561
MAWLNSSDNYGWITRLLHWLTAVAIIGLVWLGWYMVDLSYYDKWYNKSLLVHKAFGMAVFALGALTLLWRWISPSPGPQASLGRWERIASRAMHHTLFLLVFLIPATGYLISTSAGKPVEIFDWFVIPALFPVDSQLRDLAIECHFYLAYATAVLVALHAAAALKHQFIDRDGTLARMLWRR